MDRYLGCRLGRGAKAQRLETTDTLALALSSRRRLRIAARCLIDWINRRSISRVIRYGGGLSKILEESECVGCWFAEQSSHFLSP
jgi:hypothetical protein